MWELILTVLSSGRFLYVPEIPFLPGEVNPRPGMNQIAFRGRTKLEAAEKAVRAINSVPLPPNTAWADILRCFYATAASVATEERLKVLPPGSRLDRHFIPAGCMSSWRYISPTMRVTSQRSFLPSWRFGPTDPGGIIAGIFGPRQKLVPTAVGRAMNRLRAPKVMTGFQTAGFKTAGCCGGTVAGCGGPACGGTGCKPAVGCKEPTAVGSCLQYVYTDLAGSGCGYSTPCDIGCGIGC